MDVETMLNKDNIKNFLRNPLGVMRYLLLYAI